jgi:hypothetical protein
MFEFTTIGLVLGGAGGAWFTHLVATKGLPAAIAWAKAKWNAGKADLANLKGRLAAVEEQLAAIKAAPPAAAAPAAPAPAAV